MLQQILLGALLPAAAAIGFFVKRHLERRPELDALEVAQRLLAVRKDLEAQGIAASDLDAFRQHLLGSAAQLPASAGPIYSARQLGPWALIAALATGYWWLDIAAFVIAFPEPVLSLQVVYIALLVLTAYLYTVTAFALTAIWLFALVSGPFRIAA